jgi:hypothetical protein
MTTITIDVEQFTKALADTTNKTLGWVWLQPTTASTSELIPPSYTPTLPSVMASFVLVPLSNYRFEYTAVRYAKFSYLLERNGSYEAGDLTVIHDMPISAAQGNESTPPAVPAPFTPPTITTEQVVTIGSVGSLGVTFSFMHDSSTSGSTAKFGLGFKITSATPAVYPRLVAAYITAFQMEDI